MRRVGTDLRSVRLRYSSRGTASSLHRTPDAGAPLSSIAPFTSRAARRALTHQLDRLSQMAGLGYH